MSKAEINYSDLTEASRVARRISDGFQGYADELRNKIVNKLNGYSGDHTYRIDGAINNTNNKIHELENDSQRFSTFSTDIESLREQCETTDVSVGSKIQSLSSTFIDTNIVYSDNPILNGIAIATNWVLDNTPFGNDIRNAIINFRDIKSSIRKWYRNGGKETLKLIFDVSIAVASVAIAICTCGVAGVIIASALAAWDIYNARYNYINDTTALNYAKNGGDPVAARSMSRIDKEQDYLRSSFKDDFSGQSYTYNKADEEKAKWMDIGYTALSVANFAASAKGDGLLKDTGLFKNIGSLKRLSATEKLAAIKTGTITTLKNSGKLFASTLDDVGTAARKEGVLKEGKALLSTYGEHITKEYNIGYAFTQGGKYGFKAIKNVASVGQKIVDGKLKKPDQIINFCVNDIVLKGITFKESDDLKFKASDVFNFDINNVKITPFNPVTPVSYDFKPTSFALYNKLLKCF